MSPTSYACLCGHQIDDHDEYGCTGLILDTLPPRPVACPCREFEARPRKAAKTLDEAIDDLGEAA